LGTSPIEMLIVKPNRQAENTCLPICGYWRRRTGTISHPWQWPDQFTDRNAGQTAFARILQARPVSAIILS